MLTRIFTLMVIAALVSCGKDSPKEGDVVLPVGQAEGKPRGSSSLGSGNNEVPSTNPGATVPPSRPSPLPVTGTPSAGSPVTEMTLEEAKAKCASCHQPGGMGAGVWSSANGTEADWRAFAPSAKASVVAGRMPIGAPLSAEEKSRMIAFLDRLMGGGSTPATPVFTFETARALCVGCHSKDAPVTRRTRPYLETEAQWKDEKSEIRAEVSEGEMPRGKNLTTEERQALLKFIDSL